MDTNTDIEQLADGERSRLTRRGSLLKLGGLAGAIVGGSAWALNEAGDAGAGPAAVASGLVSCVLSPEMTASRRAPS